MKCGDTGLRGRFSDRASGRLLITAAILTGSVPASRCGDQRLHVAAATEIRMTIFFISKI